MKKKIIITIIILLTTVLLGVGGYFIFALNQGPATIEDSEADFESTLLEAPKDGTNPSEHSVEENVAYALWTIAHTNEFYSLTTGTAQASIANQQIYNKRVVHDGKAMVTMISSGLISTAKQKYYMKDKVLLRDATSISGDTATWITSEPECVSYKTLIQRYGWLPFQATGYIICSDTYIHKEEMKMVDNQDGTYTLYFDLDPDGNKAPFWYRREVLTNANSSIVPEFSYIHYEMKINSNWQIVSADVQETYKVKSMGVEAITKTNCHEEYFYENVAFDEEPYNYFESYAYLSVLDDEENPMENTADPMSIIVESLQNSDKSNKTLELDIAGDGFKKNGLVALNISDLTKVKLYADFGDLYVEYTDSIYISIGGIKVKTNVKELMNIISQITDELPKSDSDGSSLDVNKILADLSKSTLVLDGENVSIDTNLDILGIKLSIHFDIKRVEDTYALKSAYANVDLFGTKVELSIKESNKKISPKSHNDFMDLANLEFIACDIASIIKNKNVDFNFILEYQDISGTALGNISFEDGIHVDMNVEVSYKNNSISMDLYYFNDVIYLSMMNAKVKITTKDLLRFVQKYTNQTIDFSNDFDMASLLKTIFTIDYDSLLKELVIEEDSLDIAISLKQFIDSINEIKLSIQDSNKGLDGSISINDIKASFSLGDLGYNVREIKDSEYNYLVYIEGFIDDILVICKGKKLQVSLDMVYQDLSIHADGNLDFNEKLKANMAIDFDYKNKNIHIDLYYLEDILYFDLEDIHLKISKDDLSKMIGLFMDSDMSLDGFLQMDFESIIDSLRITEEQFELDLNLNGILDSLSKVQIILKDSLDGLDLGISIKDLFDISLLVNDSYKDFELKEEEYQDLGMLYDFVRYLKDIMNNESILLHLEFKHEILNVQGDLQFSFKEEIALTSTISASFKDLNISFNVSYFDHEKVLFIDLYNNHISIPVSLFIKDATNITIKDILDILFDSDFISMIQAMVIHSNSFEMNMNLSNIDILNSFFNDLSQVDLSISLENGKINLTSNTFGISSSITYSMDKVIKREESYIDLSDMVSSVSELISWISKESFRISLDGSVHISSIKMDLNGYIDLLLSDNQYDLSGYFHIEVSSTLHDIYFKYHMGILYLYYGDVIFGIDMNQPVEFLKDVLNALEIEMPKLTQDKLDSILNHLNIKSNGFDLDLSSLMDVITKITFIFTYNKDFDSFNLNVDSTELDIDGTIEKIDSYSITLPESYLNNEDIISLAKMVRRILNLIKNKAFNVHFDLDTIDNGSKHLNVLGDLSIFLDIPEGEKLSLDYISLGLNLAITEYDPNGEIKVIHRVELTFIDDMLYIIYGNNESNLESKIKFNLDKNSLLSTLASITSVFGIPLDFLKDYVDASLENVDFSQLTDLFKKDNRIIDVSKALKALEIHEDSIHFALSSNIISENIPESNWIEFDLISNDTTPLRLSIHGLYTDYVSDHEYTKMDVNEVMVSLDSAQILAPSSLKGYYDISDLDELVNGLLITGANKDYAIASTITLGLPVIADINVPIDARIRVLEDGSPLVYLHIDLTNITTAAKLIGLSKKNVYFYYQDGYVYIYRLENDGTSYKLKITKEELFDDIIYYLLDFSLGMPKSILDQINSSSSNEDYVVDAGTVMNSYSYSNHRFDISLNMKSLTGNSNLGNLSLGLLLKNIAVYKKDDLTVQTAYALTEIVDFNFDLVSVINLSTSSLKLTNLEDIDGYTWFKNIEMEDVVSFISSYSYGTDLIYKNDSYYGKRSHTITFILNHGENQYFTGQYGTAILFPELEVVEDSSKYYLFKGWYKDKYLHEPYLETSVGDSNITLYAKWEEVSYYNLNVHSISGDKNYSLYNGEDLSKYLNEKVYTDALGNSYIFKGYSLSLDGDFIDISSMPNHDLDLYAKWEIISYKVYIDDSYYMDLSSSTSLSLTQDYYLKANDIYFCFESTYLTYDVLAILYNEYVTFLDGVGYIYLYSDLSSLEDYYKVTLDYDYHKFKDKLYKAIVLPKHMDFSSSLLPNSIYNHMKINYWYNEEVEYHYGNIHEILHEDITLSAYYATYDYLSFGYDQSSGEELLSVTGFSYQESTSIRVILPKYVYIHNSYQILRSLLINVDSDNNKYSCFTGKENISSIIFNDGFRIIGDNAFKNCKNLTSVYFSSTVEAVASDAFYMNSKNEAKNIRFYFDTSSKVNKDKWLAYKGTFGTKYYYGESNGLGENLTSAFNTYSGRISDIVRTMI